MIRPSLLRRWIIELENSGMPVNAETIKRTIQDMKRELDKESASYESTRND